jgi:amino acid adenylation domain-containing protein
VVLTSEKQEKTEMSNESIVGYRLSPQQRHVWSLQQLYPRQSFRARCTILINGNLDPNVLSAAAKYLVSRHEILRTSFHSVEDMSFPVQVIGETADPSLTEIDVSGAGTEEQRIALDKVIAADSIGTSNLSEGPLLRLWLFKISSSSHVLLVTLPSLCADASGLKNLVRDLSRCYEACLHGHELTDEALPYIVIAEWQNELLEREDMEAGRTFWTRRYNPDLIDLKLPFEEPAHDPQFAYPTITIDIEPKTAAKVTSISSSHDCTVSTFLMTCWLILLSRLTGQPEIVVGTASDGRADGELEYALGLMTNYLPCSFYPNADSRFSEVMKQVDEETREAFELQEAFSWPTVAGDTTFAPFCFEFDERPASYFAGDVDFTLDQLLVHTDNYALKLRAIRKEDALSLAIDYNSDLYRGNDVGRVAQELGRLIESATADPENRISRLQIINDDERKQLLSDFNDMEGEFAPDKCIHQLFEEQVEQRAAATALVYEEQQLSYAELNRRANQLAQYLRRRGVGPERVVGLMLERSAEMVVAILGVLKAGGAYLPLDPAYPRERLHYMLSDSGAELLLTQRELVGQLGEVETPMVCWEDGAEWAGESEANLACETTAENLAYVIYTSGSTGKPKAVLMTHRAPLNLLAALWTRVYESQPLVGRRASLNASFSFDASVQQWLLLLMGATIHLIPQRLRADGPGLLQYLREQEVEIFDCTPSQLRVLINSGLLDGSGRAPHRLLVAGEAIDAAMWEQLRRQQEGKRIYNIYGPTECCVDATAYLVEMTGWKRPLIGKPLANYEVCVLDAWGRAVPVWVRGEICVSGAGLARGYHGRPELTAERFGPHPYSRKEGARLYRTGDLGRYLPDGNIEYLGRTDSQVKVRGYRIELGEVEAVLRSSQGVREAVVQLRGSENGEGEERLVGYVVPKETGALKVEQLRAEMAERVPEYMIPPVFVMLDWLPLNSSGKVEWRDLPEPEGQRPDLGVGFVAARNDEEAALVGIWQEVLGLEQIGVEDNFFDLGGHSLMATQVISRVREALDVELPLRAFFETPTVASLAMVIVQSRSENSDDKTLEDILREIEELPAEGVSTVTVASGQAAHEHS